MLAPNPMLAPVITALRPLSIMTVHRSSGTGYADRAANR
jgi:hypothetical protein